MASHRNNVKCIIVKELSFDDSDSDESLAIRKEGNSCVMRNGTLPSVVFKGPSIDESSSDSSGSIGEGSSIASVCTYNDTDDYNTDEDDDEIQYQKEKLSMTEALKSIFVGYSKDKKKASQKVGFQDFASSGKLDCQNVDDLTQETNSIETASSKLQSSLPCSDHSVSDNSVDNSVINFHEGHSDKYDSLEDNSAASCLGDNDTLESLSLIEDLLDYDSNDEESENKSMGSDDSNSLGAYSQRTFSQDNDSKGTLSDMESLEHSLDLDQKSKPPGATSSDEDIEVNGHEITFQDLKIGFEVDVSHVSPEVGTENEKEGVDKDRPENTMHVKSTFDRLKRHVIGRLASQRQKFMRSDKKR
jgi:hypothetical protein